MNEALLNKRLRQRFEELTGRVNGVWLAGALITGLFGMIGAFVGTWLALNLFRWSLM